MNNPTPMSKNTKITLTIGVIVLAASVYANFRLFTQVRLLENPQAVAENQIRKIVAEVGKVIVLPQDETPTIATVSDMEPLKSQPFFTNAAVGDQVLIYTKARKVVLWRPAENKIIEVAPLNITIPESGDALSTVGDKKSDR